MPFMRFNWSTHQARVWRLTYAERGLFDAIRTELWTVVGCTMPKDTLLARLRIPPGTPEAALVDQLFLLGLLMEDAEGRVFDEVQVKEFGEAVRRADVNRQNGSQGGRPRKTQPATSDSEDF